MAARASRASRNSRKRGRTALVCAGGGVTGAVYEIGALRALEELLDRSVLDFDIYVGVSGGAFVASLLAHGITPYEMYEAAVARTRSPLGVSSTPLFRLGLADVLGRSARAPRVVAEAIRSALSGSGGRPADMALSLFELLPAGLVDNSGIREYLERVFRSRGRRDRFSDLERELYLIAVDLDDGQAVAFGEPQHRSIPVSLAVQASTALPGLYRPVRIGGRDYVDGGVRKTAHINRAIQNGADLVVCINPIVPILNDPAGGPLGGHLSERGLTSVLDQAFRIMLQGRMEYGMARYRNEHPDVDIVLIQPRRSDMKMFRHNIMELGARRTVASYGYRSALEQIGERKRDVVAGLRRHGIRLRCDPASLSPTPPADHYHSSLARTLAGSLDVLSAKMGLDES